MNAGLAAFKRRKTTGKRVRFAHATQRVSSTTTRRGASRSSLNRLGVPDLDVVEQAVLAADAELDLGLVAWPMPDDLR